MRSGLLAILLLFAPTLARAQAIPANSQSRLTLRVGVLTTGLRFDGRVDDAVWRNVDSILDLTEVEPNEGARPSGGTVVKVLANDREIVIGVIAYDAEP